VNCPFHHHTHAIVEVVTGRHGAFSRTKLQAKTEMAPANAMAKNPGMTREASLGAPVAGLPGVVVELLEPLGGAEAVPVETGPGAVPGVVGVVGVVGLVVFPPDPGVVGVVVPDLPGSPVLQVWVLG